MSYELFTTAPDILHTSIMPVAQQVVHGFLNKLGLMHYFQERISYEAFGYTNTVASNEHNEPTFAENSVDTQVSYSFQSSSLRWPTGGSALEYQQLAHSPSMIHARKNRFHDAKNKIILYGYEHPMAVGIDCKLNLEDSKHAIDCMQRIRSFTSTGILEYDVDFSYIVPPEIYCLIFALYKQAGNAPEDFFTYLKENSNDQVHRLVNRHDNSDSAVCIRRSKVKLTMSVEMTQDVPDPIGDYKSPTGWRVSVNLQTQLDMPNLLGLYYPPVINNQLIPAKLIPVSKEKFDPNIQAEYPFCDIERFRQSIFLEGSHTVTPIRFPWYDNWKPTLPKDYIAALIGIFLLDDVENPEGTTTLDLPNDYDLVQPEVWDLFKQCGQTVLYFGNMLNISVFKDNIMLTPSEITLTEDLQLTIPERDPSVIYRVVLSYNPRGRGINRQKRIFNFELVGERA